ncbi:DUF4365 domain-containing protein [Vibrio campbellii]|uniref:DUF4365 domain-containing protein n=1 Tax=Vibrio campbellii TaxID=680 RepID=UPI0038571B82
MKLPKVDNKHKIGQIGVSICEQNFLEHDDWVFRAGEVFDYGVDAQIELVQGGNATGRVLALQLKTGTSFFSEKNGDGYIFRSDMEHYNYWLNHSLPVLLVLCNPDTRDVFWVEITHSNTKVTGKGWKVTIPFDNCLSNPKSFEDLRYIALKNKYKELVDNSVYRLVCERFKGIYLLQEFEVPRDLHWYQYVGELRNEKILISYVHNPITGVEEESIKEHIRLKEYNKKLTGAQKAVIFLIEPSFSTLENAQKLSDKYHSEDIEYVICAYDDGLLSEYVNGKQVYFYDHHDGGQPFLNG